MQASMKIGGEFGTLESTVGRSDDESTADTRGDDVFVEEAGEGAHTSDDALSEDDDYLGSDAATEADRTMITDLLLELERNQETFGRITETLGFSEKENLHLLEMLAQLRSERQELLANIASRHSKSRSRAASERPVSWELTDSFAGALQGEIDALRVRVASLEDENTELKRTLLKGDEEDRRLKLASAARCAQSPQPPSPASESVTAGVQPRAAATSAARPTLSYHLDDEDEDEDGPSTTLGSIERSPLPYRHHSELRVAVLVRDVATQCTGHGESVAAAPSPPPDAGPADRVATSAKIALGEAHGADIPPTVATSDSLVVVRFDDVALAKHQLVFQAEEEKLWLMVHARTRELEHVSRLLASAEGRNVDLSTLLTRLCEQQNETIAHQQPAPQAVHAAPRAVVASPAAGSRAAPVQQRKPSMSGGLSYEAPQLRSGNAPPPPARINQSKLAAVVAAMPVNSAASSNATGSDRPIRLKNTSVPSLFRRESTYGKIVLEKPKWS
jgi:hypothetical protein